MGLKKIHLVGDFFFRSVWVTYNSLKVQFYLSCGRHYRIYFMFILTLTRKYESLQVFSKIYSLRVFFYCKRFKLMSKACRHEAKRIQGWKSIEKWLFLLGFLIIFIIYLNYNFSIYHITSILIYYYLIILLLVQELCFLYLNIQFIHLCWKLF